MPKQQYKYSDIDSRGMLFVDCAECQKGFNGYKSCSSGHRIQKGHVGGCFNGILLTCYDDKRTIEDESK